MRFETLTYQNQLTRFAELANTALVAYNLEDATVSLLAHTDNIVYRVESADRDYVLRMHRHDDGHQSSRSRAQIASELEWLRALQRQEDFRVPQPVGEIYTGTLPGTSHIVHCVLFRWITGTALTPEAMQHDHLEAIGTLTAQLHQQAEMFQPSPEFTRPRRDWEGLFGETSSYDPGIGAQYFTDEQNTVINTVTDRVRETMDELDQQPKTYGLLHADLIAKNILFADGQIGVVDFDECGYGYYLYDLAPMLWVNRNTVQYAAVRSALWQGYTQVRPLPTEHLTLLETMVAARHVASCRWVAGHAEHPAVGGRAAAIIAERVAEMQRFLNTGSLAAYKGIADG